MKKALRFIWHLPRNLAIGLVLFYQKFFSPDHSFWAEYLRPQGFCKYRPSCSEYMRISLRKKGLLLGLLLGFWRIARCNPWSGGGLDTP